MSPRILLTGITGFRNRGVEALAVPSVEGLQREFPGATITIATWTPDYDRARIGWMEGVDFVHDPYLATRSWGGGPRRGAFSSLFRKVCRRVGIWPEAADRVPVKDLLPFSVPDLVVVSGGDLISSDYGTESLRHFLEPVHWARAHGVPSALIGQSIGRFRSDEDVALWKDAEAATDLVLMREPLSRDYLVRDLGGGPAKILQAADSAFLLEPDSSMAETRVSSKQGLVIGLSISDIICSYADGDYQKHIDVWAELIRMFLDEFGARVVLVPHVQEHYADDRISSTLVWRKLGFDPRVELLGADLSAAEFKGVLANCDMVIAERMHAAIGALSSGVCTIPVSYSIKAQGIISQLYEGTAHSADQICIPLADLLDLPQARDQIRRIWAARAEHAALLQKRLPTVKSMAAINYSEVAKLVSR